MATQLEQYELNGPHERSDEKIEELPVKLFALRRMYGQAGFGDEPIKRLHF